MADRGGNIADMMSNYKALLQAEQTGPPDPARRARLQAMADYLRNNHTAVLAEMERQMKATKEVPAQPARPATPGEGKPEPEASAEPKKTEPPADVKTIDPHLGEKLRAQLFAALASTGQHKS